VQLHPAVAVAAPQHCDPGAATSSAWRPRLIAVDDIAAESVIGAVPCRSIWSAEMPVTHFDKCGLYPTAADVVAVLPPVLNDMADHVLLAIIAAVEMAKHGRGGFDTTVAAGAQPAPWFLASLPPSATEPTMRGATRFAFLPASSQPRCDALAAAVDALAREMTAALRNVWTALGETFAMPPFATVLRTWRFVLAGSLDMPAPRSAESRRTATVGGAAEEAAEGPAVVSLCPLLDALTNVLPRPPTADGNVVAAQCAAGQLRGSGLLGGQQLLRHSGGGAPYMVLQADRDLAKGDVLRLGSTADVGDSQLAVRAYVCGH
jgi:hypothetical protein